MPTVHDVADELLRLADRDRRGLGHLKLQKLVYYAQAFHLGCEGEPLFGEPIRAWRYGPASPDLWRRRQHRRGDVPPPDAPSADVFTDRQQDVIELVYERFRELSSFDLVRRAQDEEPWRQAWARAGDGGGDAIPHERMRLCYRDRLGVLAEAAEFPPIEPVIDLGPLEDVAAGVLPPLPEAR